MEQTLITKLRGADLVCCDCGTKYGKYSVGCSTYHVGTCQVCGKTAPVTETRDFGYLQPGIDTEKLKIKGQSKEVAEYISSAEDYDDDQLASYELGEFCLMLTKEEVTYLRNCLNAERPKKANSYQSIAFEDKIVSIGIRELDIYNDTKRQLGKTYLPSLKQLESCLDKEIAKDSQSSDAIGLSQMLKAIREIIRERESKA